MTVQDKCLKRRFAGKAGTAWISPVPTLGLTFGRSLLLAAEFHAGRWKRSHHLPSSKLKHLSALSSPAFCLGHRGDLQRIKDEQNIPRFEPPLPQKRAPPPLYVCIHTRAHTALPPSGLQTAKGVSKQTCFRGFFPPNAINMVSKLPTSTYSALPSQPGGAWLGTHTRPGCKSVPAVRPQLGISLP